MKIYVFEMVARHSGMKRCYNYYVLSPACVFLKDPKLGDKLRSALKTPRSSSLHTVFTSSDTSHGKLRIRRFSLQSRICLKETKIVLC